CFATTKTRSVCRPVMSRHSLTPSTRWCAIRACVIGSGPRHDRRRLLAFIGDRSAPKCSPRIAASAKGNRMNLLVSLMLLGSPSANAPASEFPDALRRKAVVATVKIVNPDGGHGSGALIGREGAFAYILTAAHVVGT